MRNIHYEVVDLRDEFREFERKFRKWPRSGSVSKPYFRGFRPAKEEVGPHGRNLLGERAMTEEELVNELEKYLVVRVRYDV